MAAEPIKALAKAQSVVDILSEHGSMTPAEIADAIGMPRSSAYRLIDGLRAIDLVTTAPESRVTLAQRWLRLADASRAARSEWSDAKHALSELSTTTGLTAYLSVPRRFEAVCVEWSRGRGIELLTLRPGASLALNAGAASRALLAYLDIEADALAVQRYTPFTLVSAEELRDDAEFVRENGYSLSLEDVTIGIGAIGVPVFDSRGSAVASVSLGGLVDDVRERLEDALPPLIRAARALSA